MFAFGLWVITDGPMALPAVGLSLVLAVMRFGWPVGVIHLAVLVITNTVLLIILEYSLLDILTRPILSILADLFALIFAWLLVEYDRQVTRSARLAADVERRAGIETDLALAEERARAARELHDGLGHQLTVIGMSLQYAQRMRGRDGDRAWAEIDRADSAVSDAIAYMRRWVRALHPVRVEGRTGTAALEAIAESFRGTGLTVRVQSAPGSPTHSDPETELFSQRFVQEGLTNVLRHAHGTTVTVAHREVDGTVQLSVVDEDPNSRAESGSTDPIPEGFGLRSLRERAEALGGTIAAIRTDRGFRLSAELPRPVRPQA